MIGLTITERFIMSIVSQADSVLEPLFKDLPSIPESGRESLARIWPWIALVAGLLQLVAAWSLWRLTQAVNAVNNAINSLGIYGYPVTSGLSSTDKMVIYVGLVILAAEAVIFLLAFSPLKARLRRGWDLLFLGALVNIAYAVVSVFIWGAALFMFLLVAMLNAAGASAGLRMLLTGAIIITVIALAGSGSDRS